MSTWKPDPWLEKSEDFYTAAFKGGVCKYCGEAGKDTPLAICDCSGLCRARAAYQAQIRATPGIPVKEAKRDNPDRNHSQNIPDEPIF